MRATRKRTATFALAACLALLMFTFALPSSALAWDNCPKGLVNDPYPGACGRYVDTNGDDICDLSQSKPAAATTTTAQVTTTTEAVKKKQVTTTTTAVATTTSGEPPTGDCPLGPCANCGACLSIGSSISASGLTAESDAQYTDTLAVGAVALAAADASATTSTTIPPTDSGSTGAAGVAGTAEDSGGPALFTHYNISPIAIAFFLIYAVSFALHKTKRIRLATHRKVWNVLLAATFLITGILGLILTIQLDYELPFTIPFDLLFWHVEAGVAMTLISLFHLSWHFNYYRNVFRRSRKTVREARAAEKVRDTEERRLAWETRAQRRGEALPHGGTAAAVTDGTR